MTLEIARVNCAGCVACCHRETVVVFPDIDAGHVYTTVDRVVPDRQGNPKTIKVLAHKPNGDCVYLADDRSGCTIHGRQPSMCRVYDCADQFARMGRNKRRAMLAAGTYDRERMAIGRAKFLERQRDKRT